MKLDLVEVINLKPTLMNEIDFGISLTDTLKGLGLPRTLKKGPILTHFFGSKENGIEFLSTRLY